MRAIVGLCLCFGGCVVPDGSADSGLPGEDGGVIVQPPGTGQPGVPGTSADSGIPSLPGTSADSGIPSLPGTSADSGTPSTPLDSGAPSTPGSSADAAAPGADAGSGSTPVGDGGAVPPAPSAGPVIPAITGQCPEFKTGTFTIGGLSGISLTVGPRKQGTGSLLFYWHGTGSNTLFEPGTMMPAAMRNELLAQGGIIVAPQNSLGTGGDCSGTATFSKDDFKVADLIAACAVRDYGIDPRRIYTTGCSAGGLQSGCMAELRSSYIAAAVPNSGGIVFANALQDPKHVPAVMTMHGGAADWVAVSFSDTSRTLDNQFKKAGGFVVNCDHGGGHCGAPAELYTAGWEFMKAHPFGVAPEPYGAALPSSFPKYCKAF